MPDCQHPQITSRQQNGNPVEWRCIDCDLQFAPTLNLVAELDAIRHQNDAMLDMVTAVFSATLWDLHERAFDAHGIPHPHGDPLARDEEPDCVHDYIDGKCRHCGHSPFLGGGEK